MSLLHVMAARDWPDTGEAGYGCCYGTALHGSDRCTCWVPVYEEPQLPPRTDEPSSCMPRMCGSCAFRPGSPERTGSEKAASDWDDLLGLVHAGKPFWCHDGLRTPVAYLHPPSMTWLVVEDTMHFDAPQVRDDHGVLTPYRADGRPGDLCAGWTAMRLAEMNRRQRKATASA